MGKRESGHPGTLAAALAGRPAATSFSWVLWEKKLRLLHHHQAAAAAALALLCCLRPLQRIPKRMRVFDVVWQRLPVPPGAAAAGATL